ncbi:cupin domain-containing protein [Aureimonas fodinaquatilis]|uniref:Cupin domain-containing protein n=1 Tax=Aureimonas fodinaquatilis TaxID=2565783 RepID=A0A5B0E1S3_9HYPH|nr:cupin domain-containing protein [Aureimonas fodinaquatilis]KAA0972075.1 cupin domain-containing protein [Aureimonas fodinaquatilis]
MSAIGQGLREMRRRRQLSTRQLALRSGISHSTISLIERDRLSPSVDTLSAILEAMGATMSGFFSQLAATTHYSPFYRGDDLPEAGRPNSISYRIIGINHPNRSLLMLHETYAPGADTGQPFNHAAQEAGVVVEGAIELTVGSETQVLETGDAYYFDSQMPHRFRNCGNGQARIISAVTPPTY